MFSAFVRSSFVRIICFGVKQIFLCHKSYRCAQITHLAMGKRGPAQEGDINMAQIQVTDLTFSYDGSADDIFQNISFSIDTDWKLGLIGRNGKGKTTLLNLFMGRHDYQGNIKTGICFDYFPYRVSGSDLMKNAEELIEKWKPQVEIWQVLIQMNELKMDPECLYRPFETLSFGERTRVMLAVLFAAENEFLLIDEPTNHLDTKARDIVKAYLASKKRIHTCVP